MVRDTPEFWMEDVRRGEILLIDDSNGLLLHFATKLSRGDIVFHSLLAEKTEMESENTAADCAI